VVLFAFRFTVDEDYLPLQVGDPVIVDSRIGIDRKLYLLVFFER
jgi:hypothetical protein